MVRRSTLGIFYGALFIFGAVYSSQEWTTNPFQLQETWHTTPSINRNVTRIDFYEDLALYVDNIIENYTSSYSNQYSQWPLLELSTAWKYVKNTYGTLDTDLFLILHGNHTLPSSDQQCLNQSFLNPIERHSYLIYLIDCHFPILQFKKGFLAETAQNFETIFSQLSNIVWYGAKGKNNDADRDICGSAMSDILFYDIYRHLRSKSYPADLANWKERLRKHDDDVSGNNRRICFYKWFIPIYEKYGGASFLNRYFELTKQYWQNGGDGRYESMNLGNFIHFWSGAAGEDLQHLAAKAFELTVDQQDSLLKVRATYQFIPPYNYTVRNDTLYIIEGISSSWTPEYTAAVVCAFIVIVLVIMGIIFYIVRKKVS